MVFMNSKNCNIFVTVHLDPIKLYNYIIYICIDTLTLACTGLVKIVKHEVELN